MLRFNVPVPRALICTTLVGCVATSVSGSAAWADTDAAEELRVYAVVEARLDRAEKIVEWCPHSEVPPRAEDIRRFFADTFPDAHDVQESMIVDYIRKAPDSAFFATQFAAGRPGWKVMYCGPLETPADPGFPAPREWFHRMFPNSAGTVYLSRVGFNEMHTEALLYGAVRSFGGHGLWTMWYFLRKSGTEWRIEKVVPAIVS